MKRYLNMRSSEGVETVDELDSKDFKSPREFRAELIRLKNEYALAGMAVYVSQVPCRDWKDRR